MSKFASNNFSKKNIEGYLDTTAYEGCTRAESFRNAQAGDIFESYNSITGKEDQYLVISAGNRVCNVLKLLNDDPGTGISIISKSRMYTDPELLQYVFKEKQASFIKKVPDADFSEIKKEVSLKLGFTEEWPVKLVGGGSGNVTEGGMGGSSSDFVVLRDALESKKEEWEAEKIMEIESERNEFKTKYEIFKSLYEGLLERVMNK